MHVIILAGGLGTRLRPLTDATPKPLLPVKGKPIIEHAILNFARHGVKDVILSVGYHAGKIRDYFGQGDKWGVNIDYAIETEPLGTGGALKKAAEGLAGTFLAINGDNLADFDWTRMLSAHRDSGAQITLALFPVEDVTQYGIARLDGSKILEFIEKPAREAAPVAIFLSILFSLCCPMASVLLKKIVLPSWRRAASSLPFITAASGIRQILWKNTKKPTVIFYHFCKQVFL